VSFLKGPVIPALLAVGVTAASAAGVFALLDRSSAKAAPPPPLRNAAWTVDGPSDAPTASGLAGVWVTGDVVVRASVDGLHAVRRADGKAAWDLPVPTANGAVCALSPVAEAGIGVFSYSQEVSGQPCESYAAVDLGTGKVLWSGHDSSVQEVALDSGVAVVRGVAGVTGLDARTGAVKWTAAAKDVCTAGPGMLVADHGRVATVRDCATEDVLVLDVKTGAKAATTTPGFPATKDLGGISADPLIVADSDLKTTALSFGSASAVLPAPLTGMFPTLGDQVQPRAEVSIGGGLVCAGGPTPACFTAAGHPVKVRALPGAKQDPHDVVAVDSLAGDAARVITMPNAAQARATLCRINADGTYVEEAELSLPVSKFLGGSGTMTYPVFAYSDAKDLILVAQRPDGHSAIVDVSLAG
jgi:hypothetical protein